MSEDYGDPKAIRAVYARAVEWSDELDAGCYQAYLMRLRSKMDAHKFLPEFCTYDYKVCSDCEMNGKIAPDCQFCGGTGINTCEKQQNKPWIVSEKLFKQCLSSKEVILRMSLEIQRLRDRLAENGIEDEEGIFGDHSLSRDTPE